MGCTGAKEHGDAAPEADLGSGDQGAAGAKRGAQGKRKKGRVLQVLVAGYQQSGKSTFFKQLQIIHLNGWSPDDKELLLNNLKANIVQGLKELIEAAQDRDIEFDEAGDALCEFFDGKNPFDEDVVDAELVTKAKALWGTDEVQALWEERDSLPNLSCINLDYIMEHIDRIAAPGATPNDEDVLRTRNRTTGTVELEFCYDNKQDFKFVDVGGQKSERRKWSQVIQNPDAVLYFTSLPDFDVPIMIDAKKTKMQESEEIWEAVVKTEAFRKSIIILFLNKIDIFAEKIQKVDLSKTFPAYKGGSDPKKASKFIRDHFANHLPAEQRETLQAHVTCALDTDQIRTVFFAIRSAITDRALATMGI